VRYANTYQAQYHYELHLRGTAAPARYSYTYEVHLPAPKVGGTATSSGYGHIYDVHPCTPTRYNYTYEEHLRRRGTSTITSYIYSYDVQLHLLEFPYNKTKNMTYDGTKT
jgi:hypothetical protein